MERQLENNTPWVFPGRNDPGLDQEKNIDMFWLEIRKRADNEDMRVHDLRHIHVSHAIIKGVTVLMVPKLFGYHKTFMTLCYKHV